ncbi:putative membrane protein [uncultured Desulfatiglans sp.]|uniref:Putative membrane protein n=1 Tax=Uncultured Desulfatiglans sp. TaxID=1748965 RepID=A0A653AG04_UNCDX|nr:putative membrane protein [uncultured Desulfatiglans sp.]
MVDSWYVFAIGALILMGLQRFLYKVSAEWKCNTAWTSFAFMGTVTVLSGGVFFISGGEERHVSILLVVSAVNSLSFLLATVAHMEALKAIPTSIAYPIIRLNVVPVVLFSVLYFKDVLSPFQVVGIVLAVSVMLILTRESGSHADPSRNARRGVFLACLSLAGGAVASISSKFAALHTNPLAYMALSYFLSTVFSFGVRRRFEQEGVSRDPRPALLIGLSMGLINFGGYYLFLKALNSGPLSLVISIVGMHFVIPILLAVFLYGERLGLMRLLAVAMTIGSILLMRL